MNRPRMQLATADLGGVVHLQILTRLGTRCCFRCVQNVRSPSTARTARTPTEGLNAHFARRVTINVAADEEG
jgi:hypothetical protein